MSLQEFLNRPQIKKMYEALFFKRLNYFKEKYNEKKDKKWVWIAQKEMGDNVADYSPTDEEFIIGTNKNND